ncbi:hypothetical protein N836_30830 [Leptolyngbya sp. Heron Island J]|uniref:hypothetical protein n=1 Tax=Leptolyngbya sp. Heron Island J TaxID=1385935 RepID=UPI0003B99599|nr:hypothetical protein [Leptolyngbya sp. Heron Island J]ESA38715.1 hypothetical protein N836_30830 [Leptolyngbya sp. Heron Island J]
MLTPTHDGKFHDRYLLDCTILVEHIPSEIPSQGNLAFKGLEEEYENIRLPHFANGASLSQVITTGLKTFYIRQ